ncbi:hypothetical protein PHLGIDRAFT_288263 [Phlebiopsis gigantea 11061_1 CR5-6]|uniref:C3H1-type domain-containing protein n=1 Tax=Phlebiopsis gigantea (strain 11061_1 CR5-6) TaxID=745531 RepID=A0A0C3PRN2_PHLG1|nr:hypothetical protein PHLGIDRAFT_288263 [Phlebiopsis gigantea 11061_1 CR5-6]
MPRTAVRKHTVATPAKPVPAPACSNSAAPANVAARTPAVTAAAPKHEDPHTSTTQRAPATFDQTPQPSSSMPAAVRAANATKESGSPIASPDGDAGESRGRGRSSASGRPSKCYLYLLGKCKRGDCTSYHPPSNELAPCRKFFEGKCKTSRCPRPHITNWGNPYKESESYSSDEEEDSLSQNAEPVAAGDRRGRCRRRICEAYLAGACRRENCRLYHPPEGELKPCRNFFQGRCNKPDCPRPHITNWGNPYKETETSSSDDEDPPPEPAAQTRASESSVAGNGSAQPCQTGTPQRTKEVCRLFRRGLCRWGDSCHRLHVQGNSSGLRSQNTEPKSDLQEAQPNDNSAPMVNATGPATNSLPQDTREICRDNLRGWCRRRRCTYRHEVVTQQPDSSANVVADGVKVQGSTGAYEAVPPESTVVIPDPRKVDAAVIAARGKNSARNSSFTGGVPAATIVHYYILPEMCWLSIYQPQMIYVRYI